MPLPARVPLTEALIEQVAAKIRNGLPRRVAANALKVPTPTFYFWLKRGSELQLERVERSEPKEFSDYDGLCLLLLDSITEAEAQSTQLVSAYLMSAMRREPKWAAWWLSRRCKEYQHVVHHQVDGADEIERAASVHDVVRRMAESVVGDVDQAAEINDADIEPPQNGPADGK